MNSSPINSNVIDFISGETLDALPETDAPTSGEDIQLWSALTLGSLQKQLTGHEADPRFSNARRLVDELAKKFSTANPIDIADYFEAIEALSALNTDGPNRLDELDGFDPLAA